MLRVSTFFVGPGRTSGALRYGQVKDEIRGSTSNISCSGRIGDTCGNSPYPQRWSSAGRIHWTSGTRCASGTGIYGSLVSGMDGDHSVLIAKSILDLFTALIFACTLGIAVAVIAVPQFVIFFLQVRIIN